MDIQVKLFEDVEMCLKRISDFLPDGGYGEVRKYIENFEIDLQKARQFCKVPTGTNKISLTVEEKEFLNKLKDCFPNITEFSFGKTDINCYSNEKNEYGDEHLVAVVDKVYEFENITMPEKYTLSELGLEE